MNTFSGKINDDRNSIDWTVKDGCMSLSFTETGNNEVFIVQLDFDFTENDVKEIADVFSHGYDFLGNNIKQPNVSDDKHSTYYYLDKKLWDLMRKCAFDLGIDKESVLPLVLMLNGRVDDDTFEDIKHVLDISVNHRLLFSDRFDFSSFIIWLDWKENTSREIADKVIAKMGNHIRNNADIFFVGNLIPLLKKYHMVDGIKDNLSNVPEEYAPFFVKEYSKCLLIHSLEHEEDGEEPFIPIFEGISSKEIDMKKFSFVNSFFDKSTIHAFLSERPKDLSFDDEHNADNCFKNFVETLVDFYNKNIFNTSTQGDEINFIFSESFIVISLLYGICGGQKLTDIINHLNKMVENDWVDDEKEKDDDDDESFMSFLNFVKIMNFYLEVEDIEQTMAADYWTICAMAGINDD